MDVFMTVLGVVGVAFIASMYFFIQIEKISANSPTYSWLNLIGAFFILISIAYDFDKADLGGVLIETIWIFISLYGLYKIYLKKEKTK